MAQPETPKSSNETPKATPNVPPFLEKHEEVRVALSLPVAKDWRAVLGKAAEDLPSPNDAKVGSVMRMELIRRYQELSDERIRVARSLNAVLSFSREGKPIDSVLQAAVLRALGQFVDKRDVYEHMVAGKVPTGSPLPEYLSKYVSTREEEKFAVTVTGYMLPLQYDVRDKVGVKESPQELTPLAKEVATGAVRLKVRMNHVLQCAPNGALATGDAPYEKFLEAAGFRPTGTETLDRATVDAAKFFVGYVLKYRADIQKYADIRTGGNVEQLTVAEAMECAAQASAVGDLMREVSMNAKGLLSTELPDMRQFVGDLFEKGDFMPERMLQVALAPLAKLDGADPKQKERFEENAKAVVSFFRGGEAKNYSVGRLDSYTHNFNEAQRGMILSLADRVSGPENAQATVDRLLRATFIPADPAERDSVETGVADKLRSLVAERKLSARDAFDLYYLLETKGSDVLLAYKVVHILDSYGEQRLATELQLRLLRKLVDVATSGEAGIEEVAKEFNLSDESRTELDNVRQYLSETGVNAIEHWYQRVWSFNVNFPEIAIPLEIFGASGVLIPAGMMAWKVYVTLNVGKLSTFATMGPAEARRAFKIPANVADDQIRLAQREVTLILSEYDQLGRRFHLLRGGKVLREGKAILRAASSEELADVAAALRKRFPNATDVADKLAEVTADGDEIRKALKAAGFVDADVDAGMSSVARKLTEMSERSSLPLEVRGVQAGLRELRFNQLTTDARMLTRELDEAMDITDPVARRDALDAWIERAKKFQGQANDLAKSMPTARRLLAEEIVGKKLLTDDVWNVVEEMHAAKTVEDKMRILVDSGLSPEQGRAVKKLARLGIAGETETAVKAAETVDSLSPAAKKLLADVADAEAKGASVAKLAAEAPVEVLDDAARASEKVEALSRAAKAGRASNAVMKGAVALEVFIGVYMVYDNRQRIAEAEKTGDVSTAAILREREKSLVLATTGGVASFGLGSLALSGPAAVALAGGTWYADTLYDHAIDLNKSTVQEYVKRPSGSLLYQAETLRGVHVTDPAVENPKESRSIRRARMVEAFLRKHAAVPAGSPDRDLARSAVVRPGMAVVDFMTRDGKEGPFDLSAAKNGEKRSVVELAGLARDVSDMYAAREELAAKGLPLALEYVTEKGERKTIDLSVLPEGLTGERTAKNAKTMADLGALAKEFRAYGLRQTRSTYLSVGEIRSAAAGSAEGWTEAADVVRPMIYRRLAPAIAYAEGKVANHFMGAGFDVKRDAAMFELRKTVQRMAVTMMSALMNDENTAEELATLEKRMSDGLANIDAQKLYDGAQVKDMTSDSFNTLKYALDNIDTSFGGPLDPLSNLDARLAPVRAAKKSMEKRLGVPLEHCVSALIDGPAR